MSESPTEEKPKVYWQSSTKDIDNIDISEIIAEPTATPVPTST